MQNAVQKSQETGVLSKSIRAQSISSILPFADFGFCFFVYFFNTDDVLEKISIEYSWQVFVVVIPHSVISL